MDPNARSERASDTFTAAVDRDLVLMAPALDGYLGMDRVGRLEEKGLLRVVAP